MVLYSRSITSLWTIAHPAPLSIGFPRQKYWSGLSFPTPGDFPNLWIKPTSPALAGGFFITEPSEKPVYLAKLYQVDTLKIASEPLSHFIMAQIPFIKGDSNLLLLFKKAEIDIIL